MPLGLRPSLLPPRAAFELIDKAFVLAKRHYWAIARLGLIPFLVGTTLVHWFGPQASIAKRYLYSVPVYAVFGIMEAVTVVGAWQALHGLPVAPSAAWRVVRRRAGGAAASYVVKGFLAVFGLALLVIPGLYVIASFFAVPAVNAIEDIGPLAAARRSRVLARGAVDGILLTVGAFYIIPLVLAAWGLPFALTTVGVPRVSLIRMAVSMLWAALFVPLRSAMTAVLYLELRIRKEGYDLQVLLSSLEPSAA
jgi:hypothetical protein